MALSKERRYAYRRYLPHLQRGCAPIFVSMSTRGHFRLPPSARTLVFNHILLENGMRILLYAMVVMPDHVHLLFSAREDGGGKPYSIAEIMNGIRGSAAHSVNRLLNRKGALWEEEFFDHIPRFGEFDATVEYIYQNPVKAGLVTEPEQYRRLWIHDLL